MHVIVLRGLPGAGKSTWAKTQYPDAAVVSGDACVVPGEGGGFDPRIQGEIQNVCVQLFVRTLYLPSPVKVVIIDNANLSLLDVAPYVAIAEAFSVPRVDVVTVECDPFVAAARNTRGVPATQYAGLTARLEEGTRQLREQRPWWNHRAVNSNQQ